MATYATLTVPVRDVIGADFNESRASVWIEPTTPNGLILADGIRVGGRREQLVGGVATFANLVTTNSADNPTLFGYRVTISAPPKGASKREDMIVLTTSDFPLTGNANLKDISAAWDNIAIPPNWQSDFLDQAQAILDQQESLAGIDDTDTAVAYAVEAPGSATRAALSDLLAPNYPPVTVVTPGVAGVVGDGISDDTAAIQALIDATPTGGTLHLKRPAVGWRYIINGNLVVDKSSLRITSEASDIYGVCLHKPTGSGAIITVKGAGFYAERLHLIGDGMPLAWTSSPSRAASTVTGIEFWGTPNGDVDGHLNTCSFYMLGTAVVTRGRNLATQNCIFSNSRNGVTHRGNVSGYHTTAAATKVMRGFVTKNNRFHGMGETTTDACILFDGSTMEDFRHSEVSNNYFDMWGLGRGVVAAGISGRTLKGIVCRNNYHADCSAPAYEFGYVDRALIDSPTIFGGGTAELDINGISLVNASVVSIVNPVMYGIGRTGIAANTTSYLRIVNPIMQAGGVGSSSTGHGIDVNTGCSNVTIIEPMIHGFDGWGITGSPTGTNRLAGGNITSCTLGVKNSTTL